MMKDMELTRVRAEGRVKLLAVILVLFIMAGGVREYMAFQAPGAEATVIYVHGKEVVKEVPVIVEQEAPKQEVSAPVSQEETDGAAVFLDYLNEVHKKLENISKPESALDQIVISEEKVEKPAYEVIFDDGRIEIYDSEEGVIGVEETGVSEEAEAVESEPVAEEVSEVNETVSVDEAVEVDTTISTDEAIVAEEAKPEAEVSISAPDVESAEVVAEKESAETEVRNDEVFVNTNENLQDSVLDMEDGEATDMMKEIIERAEEEAQ